MSMVVRWHVTHRARAYIIIYYLCAYSAVNIVHGEYCWENTVHRTSAACAGGWPLLPATLDTKKKKKKPRVPTLWNFSGVIIIIIIII